MKKILTALILAIFLGLTVGAVMALAQAPPAEVTKCKMRHDITGTGWTDKGFYCPAKGADCPFEVTTTTPCVGVGTTVNCTCGSCCLIDTIYTVTDWIFVVAIAISVIMIIWGAFNLLTAAGDVAKVDAGRVKIQYAIIGFIVAILAKAIPAIAKNILGI